MDKTYRRILKFLAKPRIKHWKFGPLPPPPEHTRLCPLCKSDIKMFYIDENVVVLNCENEICPFPYGYEYLQFLEIDDMEFSDGSSTHTQSTLKSPSSCMTERSETWSDIEKRSSAIWSDDEDFDEMSKTQERTTETEKLNDDKTDRILKNVEDIKELHNEMFNMKKKDEVITDPKAIKSLLKLQQVFGTNILKPKEIEVLNEYRSKQPGNHFNINVEQGLDNISTIKIDIATKKN